MCCNKVYVSRELQFVLCVLSRVLWTNTRQTRAARTQAPSRFFSFCFLSVNNDIRQNHKWFFLWSQIKKQNVNCTRRFYVYHVYADRRTRKNHLKSSTKIDENNFAAPTAIDRMAFLMENVSVPAKYQWDSYLIRAQLSHSILQFYHSKLRWCKIFKLCGAATTMPA